MNLKINEKILMNQECTQNILGNKPCYKYIIKGCLTFIGFSKLFKKTKSPNLCEKSGDTLNLLNPERSSSFIVYKATPELNDHYWCPSTYGHKAEINYNLNENNIPFLDSVNLIFYIDSHFTRLCQF